MIWILYTNTGLIVYFMNIFYEDNNIVSPKNGLNKTVAALFITVSVITTLK